jgi:hypothetical protein
MKCYRHFRILISRTKIHKDHTVVKYSLYSFLRLALNLAHRFIIQCHLRSIVNIHSITFLWISISMCLFIYVPT